MSVSNVARVKSEVHRSWVAVLSVMVAYLIAFAVYVHGPSWDEMQQLKEVGERAAAGRYVLQLVLVPAAAASFVVSLASLRKLTARSELHLSLISPQSLGTGDMLWVRPEASRIWQDTESIDLSLVLVNRGQSTATLYSIEVLFPTVWGPFVPTEADLPNGRSLQWLPIVGRRSDCWLPGTVLGRSVLRFYSNNIVGAYDGDTMIMGTVRLHGPLLEGSYVLPYTILDSTGRHVRGTGVEFHVTIDRHA